jgi:hypothetical protein
MLPWILIPRKNKMKVLTPLLRTLRKRVAGVKCDYKIDESETITFSLFLNHNWILGTVSSFFTPHASPKDKNSKSERSLMRWNALPEPLCFCSFCIGGMKGGISLFALSLRIELKVKSPPSVWVQLKNNATGAREWIIMRKALSEMIFSSPLRCSFIAQGSECVCEGIRKEKWFLGCRGRWRILLLNGPMQRRHFVSFALIFWARCAKSRVKWSHE